MKFGPHLEIQRYIDPPSRARLVWRSYMAHFTGLRRDHWVAVSVPVALRTKD